MIKKLVLGTSAKIYLSDNGESWLAQSVFGQLFFDSVSMTIVGLNDNLFITKDLVNINTMQLPSVPKQSRFSGASFDSVNGVVYVACSWYRGFLQQAVVYFRTLSNVTWNSFTLDRQSYTTEQIVSGNGVTVVQGVNFDGIRLYSSKDGTSWETTLHLNARACMLSYIGPDGAKKFFVSCGIAESYASVDGFNWNVLGGSAGNIFGISYDPNWGYVGGQFGAYVQSSDGMNFGPGGKVTDTVTPFTDFACAAGNCLIVSSYDNSIFISSS